MSKPRGAWLGRAGGAAVVACWLAVPVLCGAADGRDVADNVVIFGDDGRSALVSQSDDAIEVFSRKIDLPASGGGFHREKVWADRQTFRLTSLNGKGLVFLGNERVGDFEIAGHADGDELFRFSEHGHTLRLMQVSRLSAADGGEDAGGIVVDARVTRP